MAMLKLALVQLALERLDMYLNGCVPKWLWKYVDEKKSL